MSPDSNSEKTPPTSSALIPFLPEFSKCRTMIEAAGTAARILTEELGAVGVIVLDEVGPIAARPTRLDAVMIAELSSAPDGISIGPAATILADMTVASFPVRNSVGMKLVAAWNPQTVLQAEEVRATAATLAEWIHKFRHRSDQSPGRHGPQIPASLLSRDDFTGLIETIPAIAYLAEMGDDGR